MEKRFFRVYPFLSAVAAFAAAAFLSLSAETGFFLTCNLFAITLIYYNSEVIYAPNKDEFILLGRSCCHRVRCGVLITD